MEKILVELGKALIPDILYPAKHTGLSFVCFMGAIALYWHLMLNDDDVDDWKKGLQYTVAWVAVSALGFVLATGEFTKIEAGETYSRFFISGMLLLSIVYVVISISAWWVRDSCLVLVLCQSLIEGYSFLSLIRASSVVNRQWTVVPC